MRSENLGGVQHFFWGGNNLLMLFNIVMWHCRASSNEGNKWLLFDVNPKTVFLEVNKFQKPQNNKTFSIKNNSKRFGYKTIDLICYLTFFVILQQQQKSRMRGTKHLSTDAYSSNNTIGGWTKNTKKTRFFWQTEKITKITKSQKRLEIWHN